MYKNILILADGSSLTAGPQDGAIRSLACTMCTNGDTELAPGTVGAAELAVELYAGGERIAAGDRLTWYTEADGARTLMGQFWAEKPTRTSANTVRILAYDAVLKTEKNLSPWLKTVKFPIGLYAFAKAVCAQCGLELANADLPNASYPIRPFYADDLTARQLLAWVGQACGRFCRATPDGKLEFAWYTPPDWRHSVGAGEDGLMLVRLSGDTLRVQDGAPPDDGPELYRLPFRQTWYYQDSLSFEEYETAELDKVELRQSESDVGVIYPADAAGTNALVISGNLLLTTDTDADLRPVARTLYEQLRDIAYTPCRVTVPAESGLRAGMAAWVTDRRDRTFLTYIMQSTVSGGRVTLESTGSARRDAAAAVNRQVRKNLRGKLLELETGVDGLRARASELAGDYAELSLTVEGLSSTVEANKKETDEQLGTVESQLRGEIQQSAESVTSTLTRDVETKLGDYSTTEQMRSAIEQSAAGIRQTVSETYSTKTETDKVKSEAAADAAAKADAARDAANGATDGKLKSYPTTTQMRSAIEQTAKSITLSVTNGAGSSALVLKAGETELSSATITFTGLVDFVSKTDLSTAGGTTINGANIQTGTVTASHLSLSDLSDTKATLGGWSLSATRILSSAGLRMGGGEAGVMLINEADMPFLYAQDASGRQTFAIDRAGNATFAGTLSGATGSFSGTVEAAAGHIGGWQITSQSIDNGTPYTGAKDSNATGVGGYGGGWAFWAGNGRFSVQQDGSLHAENADITGTINATNGYFAGTVYANRIAVGGDYGYITGAQIGGATITGGNIGSDTVARGNLAEKYATSAQFNTLSSDVATIRNITTGSATASVLSANTLAAVQAFRFRGTLVAWQSITDGKGYSHKVLVASE